MRLIYLPLLLPLFDPVSWNVIEKFCGQSRGRYVPFSTAKANALQLTTYQVSATGIPITLYAVRRDVEGLATVAARTMWPSSHEEAVWQSFWTQAHLIQSYYGVRTVPAHNLAAYLYTSRVT